MSEMPRVEKIWLEQVAMDEFLSALACDLHSPQPAKNLVLSILGSAAVSLITIPLTGRMVAYFRTASKPTDIKRSFNAALFAHLETGFFATEELKQQNQNERKRLTSAFDALPTSAKMQLLTLAIKDKTKYRELVTKKEANVA